MAAPSILKAAVDEFGRRLDRHEEAASKSMVEVNEKLDAIAKEQRAAHGAVLGMLAVHGEKHVAAELKIENVEKRVEQVVQDRTDVRKRMSAWVLGILGTLLVGGLGHLVGKLVSAAFGR